MMTLQGMADHRFTSVSLFTNVFLGEIIYLRPSLPLNAKNCYGLFEVLWKGLAAGCHSKKQSHTTTTIFNDEDSCHYRSTEPQLG